MSFNGPRPHLSPFDVSSTSITPFAPKFTVTIPSRSWLANGMKIPVQFESAFAISGLHDLREVRRSDFLFAFRDEDKIDRHFPARSVHRMERSEERRLRTF